MCLKGYCLKGFVERKCEKKVGINVVYWIGNVIFCEGQQLLQFIFIIEMCFDKVNKSMFFIVVKIFYKINNLKLYFDLVELG